MKVLIAGGGTGGHIYPGIAVAEELKRIDPTAEFLFVGGDRGLEGRVVPEAGFDLVTIAARGLPRRALWRVPFALLVEPRRVLHGARASCAQSKPDVVLGTGGYVSAPVVVAAWLARRPVLLQEQNSVPGLTNRLLARVADEVHVAFTESRELVRAQGPAEALGQPGAAHDPLGRPQAGAGALRARRAAADACSCSAARAARGASTRPRSTPWRASRPGCPRSSSCRPARRTSRGRKRARREGAAAR